MFFGNSAFLEYSFKDLQVYKLTAGCIDENLASIRAFKKAGFKYECTRLKHNYFSEKYHDIVMLCKFKEDNNSLSFV